MTPSTNPMQGVYTLNPEQAQRALALCWKAGVPVALIGGVGCGKTTSVRDFVAKLNTRAKSKYKLWTCILSYLEASDIGGVPVPIRGEARVKFHMPDFLPFDCDDAGVVFGDEFDRATPDVQNAFLQVLLGGEFHGHSLSKNAYVVLAMNGSSDIYTTELSRAARTRLCSLFVSRHADGAHASYQDWAEREGVDDATRAFAQYRSDLYEREADFEELALCVPRTVDMAGKVMEAAQSVKFQTDDILTAVIAGLIGRKAATEYLAIRELIDNAPSPEEVCADPDEAAIPDKPSVLFALTSALVNYCEDREDAAAIVTYAVRLKPEWAAALLKKVSAKEPSVVTLKTFCDWKNEHAALLM